jgi:hypothetical protein
LVSCFHLSFCFIAGRLHAVLEELGKGSVLMGNALKILLRQSER